MNSRAKGKRGELQLCEALRSLGFADARRSQQFCGRTGAADLTDNAIPGFHVECKSVASIGALRFAEQAERDAKEGVVPLVCMKANRSSWYTMLRLEDFANLYRMAHAR